MTCAKSQKIGWLDKVNFIRHYAVDSCSTTLKVYVETGVAADENLVMGVVNTSPTDFVRFLLRPKGARTMRHGIRSLTTNEAAAEDELIPDTAKLAADTVHLVTGWHVPTWTEAGDALFEIAKPFFTAQYYLLMANVVTDFAFDWYSGILLSPASKCDIGRWLGFSSDDPDGSFAFKFFNIDLGGVHTPGVHATAHGVFVPAGTWCVIFDVDIYNNPFHPQDIDYTLKMVLGEIAFTDCGKSQKISISADQPHVYKRFVRKVEGPETINLMSAAFWHGPPGQEVRITVGSAAFVI